MQQPGFPLQGTFRSRRQIKIIPQDLNREFKSFKSTLKSEVAAASIARVIIAKDKNKESSGILCRHKIKWVRKVKVMLKGKYKSQYLAKQLLITFD